MEQRLATQAEVIQKLQTENQYLYQELDAKLSAIDAKLQDAMGRSTGYGSSGPYWSGSAPDVSRSPYADPGRPPYADSGRSGVPSDDAGTYTAPSEPYTAENPSESEAADWSDSSNAGAASGDERSQDGLTAADLEGMPPETQAKRVYEQAYLDLTRGNYSLAILGFGEYLRRAETSDLADNAQYWIGECYYAQGDYRQAVVEFQKVVDRYPNADKVAGALLKIGFSEIRLGDKDDARTALSEVIQRFPNGEEAKLARDKLRSIE
ncbi:MAG: tol-pal system protein YbgF [Candidatus Eisenbacteria bacterium]